MIENTVFSQKRQRDRTKGYKYDRLGDLLHSKHC